MRLVKWVKNKMVDVALAMSKVEEDTLSQGGLNVEGGIGSYQRVNQGRLSDSLQRGEITQEVKELRWRMYKIMKATDGVTATINGYDEYGMPIVEVKEKSKKRYLKNIKVDAEDSYKPIMVVDNSEVTLGVFLENVEELPPEEIAKTIEITRNEATGKDEGRASIGKISSKTLDSSNKSDRPIKIIRDIRTKFNIEDYTNKMVVREIGETERLLEFYVSIYPDEYNKKSRFFLSELKRATKNPRACNSLDINGVNYITSNTMGASDYELYEYGISGIHKIVEFDGHYVIKFKANVTTNGENIIDKFRELELDKRYENKEVK